MTLPASLFQRGPAFRSNSYPPNPFNSLFPNSTMGSIFCGDLCLAPSRAGTLRPLPPLSNRDRTRSSLPSLPGEICGVTRQIPPCFLTPKIRMKTSCQQHNQELTIGRPRNPLAAQHGPARGYHASHLSTSARLNLKPGPEILARRASRALGNNNMLKQRRWNAYVRPTLNEGSTSARCNNTGRHMSTTAPPDATVWLTHRNPRMRPHPSPALP